MTSTAGAAVANRYCPDQLLGLELGQRQALENASRKHQLDTLLASTTAFAGSQHDQLRIRTNYSVRNEAVLPIQWLDTERSFRPEDDLLKHSQIVIHSLEPYRAFIFQSRTSEHTQKCSAAFSWA